MCRYFFFVSFLVCVVSWLLIIARSTSPLHPSLPTGIIDCYTIYNLQFPELSVTDDDDFYVFTGRRGLRQPNHQIPVVMNQHLFLNMQLDVDHLLKEHGSGNSDCPNGTCENLSSVYSMQCGHPLFCFCCYVALFRHLGISDTFFKCGIKCFECTLLLLTLPTNPICHPISLNWS